MTESAYLKNNFKNFVKKSVTLPLLRADLRYKNIFCGVILRARRKTVTAQNSLQII